MESPACEKNEEVKIIRYIDRKTAVRFIVDFLVDPGKKPGPDQYKEIQYVTNK